MKHLALAICVAMVIATLPAMSADSTGPLSPAGAAGVQQAQGENDKMLYTLAGVGVLIALTVLIFANNNGGGGRVSIDTCRDCVPILIPHAPAIPLAPITGTTSSR